MTSGQALAEHGAGPKGFKEDFLDAVTPRTVFLAVGIALLQIAFIGSYIAAFHHPTPHRVPVALIAPEPVQSDVLTKLNGLPGTPLAVSPAPSLSEAKAALGSRHSYGVFIPNPGGTTDRLVVRSATSASAATAVVSVFERVEASLHRQLVVDDLQSPIAGDQSGTSSFYLVVGWVVGGYLLASLLGISVSERPASVRRAGFRFGALAIYALATGLGGALVVGPWLHALPAATLAYWWVGSLVVFGVGAMTIALQAAFGITGIGITVLLFVILGNPSSGGPYAWCLLPPFWRLIGPWIPNGAGVDAIRSLAYLNGVSIGRDVAVLVAYGVLGVALTYLVVGVAGHPLIRLRRVDERQMIEARETSG